MTSLHPDNFESPNDTQRSFVDQLKKFDVSDLKLLMAYGRYIENPGDVRYRELNIARNTLIDDFENTMESLEYDGAGPSVAADERYEYNTATAATLLIGAMVKHDELLSEYTDEPVLTPEAIESMRDQLVGCFEEGGHSDVLADDDQHEAFVAHALSHLNEMLATDDDVIARLADDEMELPRRKAERMTKRVMTEVARVAVASAVALAIVYRFKK